MRFRKHLVFRGAQYDTHGPGFAPAAQGTEHGEPPDMVDSLERMKTFRACSKRAVYRSSRYRLADPRLAAGMVRQDQTSVVGDGHSGTLRQRRACRHDLKPFQVQDGKHHRSDFPRLIDRWIGEGKNGSSGESSDLIIANGEIHCLYRFVEPM